MAHRSTYDKSVLSSPVAVLNSITQWPSTEARKWAVEQIPVLCRTDAVCAVVLFGSIVRNVGTATDLDVLYIYEGSAPIHTKPPIDVDLRRFKRQQVEGLLKSGNDLLSWCIKFGRPVCERNQYWSELVRTWASHLGLPSAEVALDRAKKTEKLLRDIVLLGDDDAALELYLTTLTHLSRATLIDRGVYPASRPELPSQLTQIGEAKLASYLREAIFERNAIFHSIRPERRKIWGKFLDEIELSSNKARAT